MVRISIRDQLIFILVLTGFSCLLVISIPIWNFVHEYIVKVEIGGLTELASLKADQISSELLLVQSISQATSTRLLLQRALGDLRSGKTYNVVQNARSDLQSAMRSSAQPNGPLQARLYTRSVTGQYVNLLMQVTSQYIEDIELPYSAPNGVPVILGTENGYPPSLYPNITTQKVVVAEDSKESFYAANAFPHIDLNQNELLLGPLVINETVALVSVTLPVRSFDNFDLVLGYMTLVLATDSLLEAQSSSEGLGSSGVTLLIGPDSTLWRRSLTLEALSAALDSPNATLDTRNITHDSKNTTSSVPKHEFELDVAQFVLPPIAPENSTEDDEYRHNLRSGPDGYFALMQYPAVLEAFEGADNGETNASASLSTTNERGLSVSIGICNVHSPLVDWVVVIEKAKDEAFKPIDELKSILLGCVMCAAIVITILVFPGAHWGVMPLRRLKAATRTSVTSLEEKLLLDHDFYLEGQSCSKGRGIRCVEHVLRAIFQAFFKRHNETAAEPKSDCEPSSNHGDFKVPDQVEIHHGFFADEITELSQDFNGMSRELDKQYGSLEQKVAERTQELEISKKEAEDANRSKTIFIANISHELKTPLNHIIGLCSLGKDENDIDSIKASLKTMCASGQLLHRLLEDLLAFSKNQSGNPTGIDETEFYLHDIRALIVSFFQVRAADKNISFSFDFVDYENANLTSSILERHGLEDRLQTLGPPGMGDFKSASFWGDQNRIMQIITNLVSNSLKFMSKGGEVKVRVRCLGKVQDPEEEEEEDSGAASLISESGSVNSGHDLTIHGSPILEKDKDSATALAINRVVAVEKSPASSTAPRNAKTYLFEIEVADTGPGIPEDMQEKIFEPFVQGELGLNRRHSGTGLGLSICSQLVKMMRGTISVHSKEGEGSTFSFTIPLKFAKNDAPSITSTSARSCPLSSESSALDNPRRSLDGLLDQVSRDGEGPSMLELPRPFSRVLPVQSSIVQPMSNESSHEVQMPILHEDNKADQRKMRVLLAEDNAINAMVAKKMLRSLGIDDVTVAKDGQEAYDAVKTDMEKEFCFDLVLMDVQMPNLDGLESTRLIREFGYTNAIVALTAFTDESNVEACLEAGMNEFLGKPIKKPAMEKVLQKYAPSSKGLAGLVSAGEATE